ncbi:MAG: hypothetical protein Q8S20_03885 [Sulfuritalea sp.]|nr:hypothetical protein [Sulfuritalea sp.]
MKLHAPLATLLLAATLSISFGAHAAADADTAKVQAEPAAVTKVKPHSHMQEKTGMMSQKASANPESDKAKVAKAKTDKNRHLHPRDAK